MNAENILLSEKTRVSISIATLLFVLGFSITATFTFTTWKTRFESQLENVDEELTTEILERKIADEALLDDMESTMAVLLETQTNLAEIKTDLKWIKSFLISTED